MALDIPNLDPNDFMGPYSKAYRQSNALQNEILQRKIQELKNKYYGPSQEADIAYKNLVNQYYGPEKEAAIKHQNLINQYYGPNIESEMRYRGAQTNRLNTLTPLEAAELKLKNQFYPELTRSQIEHNKQLAAGIGTGSVQTQDLAKFGQQIKLDNPKLPNESENDYQNRINQMQSAYLSGNSVLPGNKPLPPLSGTAEQLLANATTKNAPTAVKNQAVQYDLLYQDLKGFPIDDVAYFAGPAGRAKLAYAKANMFTNPDDPNIDPRARNFLTAMGQAIYNMDSMRKAFGTSIVPDYVYNTIGRLTNPTDNIWLDPTQVKKNYAATIKQVGENRDLLYQKVKKGVTAGAEKKEENKASIKKNPREMTTAEIEAELARYGK